MFLVQSKKHFIFYFECNTLWYQQIFDTPFHVWGNCMHHSGQKKMFKSTMQSVLPPTLMPTTSSHKHTLFCYLQKLIRQLIRSGLILEITVGEEHKGLCSCYYVVFCIMITNFLLPFWIRTLLFLQIIRSRNSPVATSRIIIFLEILSGTYSLASGRTVCTIPLGGSFMILLCLKEIMNSVFLISFILSCTS